MKRPIAFVAALCVSLWAWAHGGEDHGDAAAPALAADIAPRAQAQSDEFELLAVLAQGELTVYLDRYSDNAPVADAEIEVESGAFKAVARQVAPGVYTLPADAFAPGGKYPLTFVVQAGDSADLLSATLETGGAPAGVEHVHSRSEWSIWAAAAAVLLAGAALIVARQQHYRRR